MSDIQNTEVTMDNVKALMRYAIQTSASDVHIKTNRESSVRIKGEIKRTNVTISKTELMTFIGTYGDVSMDKINQVTKKEKLSLDAAVSFEGRRFRLHLYMSMNNLCAVLRLLAERVPDLSSLRLPASIEKFTTATSGLVLICGATGSGKTTTIASIINQINHIRSDVIITIEDPIEYVYTEDKAVIEQREVGSHVESFTQATIDALREDPDIVVVGEMRDLETIKNAITLAETGHLVFGTLHTKSCLDAIDRMVDVFPPEQQTQIRVQLANVLYGIVHQQLISSNNSVVAVCEVLMADPVIASSIKSPGKSQNTLKDYMRGQKDKGCVHIVDNCLWHIKEGRLKFDDVRYNLAEDDQKLLKNRLGFK